MAYCLESREFGLVVRALGRSPFMLGVSLVTDTGADHKPEYIIHGAGQRD